MKAVIVEGKGRISICDDIPMPAMGPYDALVRIKTCGFCNGTDTRIIFEDMSREQGLMPYPTILGHEAAGIVEAVGDKVRNIAIGEKHIRIQGPKTDNTRYTSTHGQMAEYGLIHDWGAERADGNPVSPYAPAKPARLPDDFDLVDAGVLLPLCECLSAVRNFDIRPEHDVLVYGAGPMGLAMMQYMHILGIDKVTCVDSVPERLQKALSTAKVNQVINFQTDDVNAILKGRYFDRVVDAVGLSSVILEATARLKPYGVVCCLGVLKKDDGKVNLSALKNNTSVHMLNFPFHEYDVLEENIGYIQQGILDPKDYYSHVLPMEQVEEALRLVMERKTIKVILTF